MPACYVAVFVSFWMKPVDVPGCEFALDLDDALWFAVVRVFTTKCIALFLLLTGLAISMESNYFCRLLCCRLAMNVGRLSVARVSEAVPPLLRG